MSYMKSSTITGILTNQVVDAISVKIRRILRTNGSAVWGLLTNHMA